MDSSPQTTTRPYLRKHFLVRLNKKVFLLLGAGENVIRFYRLASSIALRSIRPEMQTISAALASFVNRSREIASNEDRARPIVRGRRTSSGKEEHWDGRSNEIPRRNVAT